MNLAEFFKHDFEDVYFELYDKNGSIIFWEKSNKFWERYERNENGKITFWENSDGDTAGTPRPQIPITNPNSIAQFFNHDFKDGVFKLYDKNGLIIFWEDSDGYWKRYERNEKGNVTFLLNSNKYWERFEYDKNRKVTSWVTSYNNTWGTPKTKLN